MVHTMFQDGTWEGDRVQCTDTQISVTPPAPAPNFRIIPYNEQFFPGVNLNTSLLFLIMYILTLSDIQFYSNP